MTRTASWAPCSSATGRRCSCPPRPEGLTYGILKLRAMILSKPDQGWRTRYGGRGTEEFLESELDLDAARHAVNISGGGKTGNGA